MWDKFPVWLRFLKPESLPRYFCIDSMSSIYRSSNWYSYQRINMYIMCTLLIYADPLWFSKQISLWPMYASDASARPSAAAIRRVIAAAVSVACFALPGPTGRMAASWPWATIVHSLRTVSLKFTQYLCCCCNLESSRSAFQWFSLCQLCEWSHMCGKYHSELYDQVWTGLQRWWRRRLLRLCSHSQARRLRVQGWTEL